MVTPAPTFSRFVLGSAARVMLVHLTDRGPITNPGPSDLHIAKSLVSDGLATVTVAGITVTDAGRIVRHNPPRGMTRHD